MKIELESQDIEVVAQRVVELLKPYLSNIKQDEQDLVFDKKQLAAYLNIDVSWIDKNYEEKLPHFHIGKYIRFKKSKIDKLADAHNTRAISLVKTSKKGMTS